jgi:hypothetical protein
VVDAAGAKASLRDHESVAGLPEKIRDWNADVLEEDLCVTVLVIVAEDGK